MEALGFWPTFAMGALATWRLAHLLAYEDGPADLVLKLRAAAGATFLGRLMDCVHCTALWVAMPFAALVGHDLATWTLAWLALAGAASAAERALPPFPTGGPDELLWTAPRDPARTDAG